MGKKLNFSYDRKGDVLDISLGKSQPAVSEEVQDDFYVRIQPKTKAVVGFMILNFSRRSQNKKSTELPVFGAFSLDKNLTKV